MEEAARNSARLKVPGIPRCSDATRLLGGFLRAETKNVGAAAGGKKTGPRGTYREPRDATPTLADLGLTKKVA